MIAFDKNINCRLNFDTMKYQSNYEIESIMCVTVSVSDLIAFFPLNILTKNM